MKQMDELDVLDSVEQTSSKNTKIELLANNRSQNLDDLLLASLSFQKKFHLKKFDDCLDRPQPIDVNSHSQFMGLLKQLENRSIVGLAAQNMVEQFLSGCSDKQRKWYSRVIRKDLDAGFSESTANKAGYKIPKFDVMLAKDAKKCKNLEKIVKAGVYVSEKLDGYRCLAVCNDGNVQLFSRNGKAYNNFTALEIELSALSQGVSFVLDGEIMSNDFSQMQQSAFASKRGTTVGDIVFNVFGYISYQEWNKQEFKQTLSDRIDLLDNLNLTSAMINKIQQHKMSTLQGVLDFQLKCEDNGFEGVMVLPDVPYYLGRKSNRLMKFKTMQTQDCVITAVNEGSKKYANTFGSFTVKQQNGTTCNVGSGYSDVERDDIWSQRDTILGRLIEVKYQDLSNDGIMRFPIFMRYRCDGDGNKK